MCTDRPGPFGTPGERRHRFSVRFTDAPPGTLALASDTRVAHLLSPGMNLPVPPPPRRLMVVDNDHDLADSMCAWIGLTTDWTAIPAYGIEQAIAKAREERYGCILLDIAMPSLGGFDAAAMLDKASETGHPALLAITGDADLRDAASTDMRFAASLLKPADSDRLLGLLAGLAAHN